MNEAVKALLRYREIQNNEFNKIIKTLEGLRRNLREDYKKFLDVYSEYLTEEPK